jgi:hypothetical protein
MVDTDPIETMALDDTPPIAAPHELSMDTPSAETHNTPFQPKPDSFYIETKHHARSGKPTTYVSLDEAALEAKTSMPDCAPSYEEDIIGRPWAPFRTLADFEAARICVEGRLPDHLALALFNGAPTWGDGTSFLTLRSISDLDNIMEKARRHVSTVGSCHLRFLFAGLCVCQWNHSTLSSEYNGELKTYDFWWREPLDYAEAVLTDASLMEHSTFYPSEKILHQDGNSTRIYDEPWTAQTWQDIQVRISFVFTDYNVAETEPMLQEQLPPDVGGSRHCYLPLHVWQDEGRVSSHVQMHPMIVRPAWIASPIRNTFGFGGGFVTAFFPRVRTSVYTQPKYRAYRCYKDLRTRRYRRSTTIGEGCASALEDGYLPASLQHRLRQDAQGIVGRASPDVRRWQNLSPLHRHPH